MKKRLLYIITMGLLPVGLGAQDNILPDLADTVAVTRQAETYAYGFVGAGPEVFEGSPEYDVAKALYGKLSGLLVNQGIGSSASNLSSINLHGKAPLVLIDGYPRSLSDITASEIESIQILKDAASAAIYGVEGGNGVVLVKTKRGTVSPLKVTAQYQYGVHTPFRMPDFADGYTYANKLNEALELDGFGRKYNARELQAFKNHEYPFYFPDVDWQSEIYKKAASNHRMMLTFRGGSQRFRYFTAIDYMYDDALYRNQSDDDRYNVNHYDTRLGLRANIDVDITKTTVMKFGVMARLSQYNRTNATGIDDAVYHTPAIAFPVKTENGFWGGSNIYQDRNPVALLNDKGAYNQSKANILADVSLRQDFTPWVKGLSAELAVAFDYAGSMTDTSTKQYRYAETDAQMTEEGALTTSQTIYGLDSKTLGHSSWFENLTMRSTFEAKINYERTFAARHRLDASAIYRQRSYLTNGRNTSTKTQEGLVTVSYGYDNRYLADFVANWSGSAYLPKGERFGFYPAANLAWVMSNEDFMQDQSAVSYLKLFVSGGLSGYHRNMEHELFRQSYIWSGSYNFGTNVGPQSGRAEGPISSLGIKPEQYLKVSGGFDLKMLDDRLSLYAEGFYENRSHILVTAQNISGILGVGVKKLDMGIEEYAGADFSVSWKDKSGDFSYGIWANGSYVTSTMIEDGQAYQRYDYLYHKGNPVSQIYGLEAEGFFSSPEDIKLSPKQTFGDVKPGDIKYKDQNDDNKIDGEDIVPLEGLSSFPKFTFGFGINLKYRNWELAADFSGYTGVSVNLLNSPLYQPMVSNGNISDTFIDRETTWSHETADYATMPRLTTLTNENNYRNSSLWYRDGSFIKLRNLMLSYTFPKKMIKFSDMKIYLQGTNLFSIDSLGFCDPEQLTANYPATRAFWVGVKFSF